MSVFFKHSPASDKRKKSGFVKPLEGMAQGAKEQRALLEMANYYQQLQNHLRQVVTAPMNEHCHVISYHDGQLHIAVPSAAFAAKLRQMAPSLAHAMLPYGYPIRALKIKILAGLAMPTSPSDKMPTHPPSSLHAAHAALQKLHKELTPGPLADTIQKILIKRSK